MADDIYDRIRSLIASGTYLGGDVLPESELATRLGVSRTPVREAMRRLQAEGIIRREAHRRAVVVEIDPGELLHIFTARAALEPIAVGMAAQKIDPAFLAELCELHDRMDDAIHAAQPDRRGYRELNAKFHRAIWAQGGNSFFAELVNSVARKPVVSPTFNHWTVAELTRSNRQHGEIIDALTIGDAEWAEAAMRAHLLSSRATFRRVGIECHLDAGKREWLFPESRADAAAQAEDDPIPAETEKPD
ncbi:GntR family transcriptional regulator [Paracoccus sp. M683]|uniref:GntR family transcriptional regulator n=1 Tax=Paracoccus sp. M683 TaxID=2594268 RepID=UPI00117F4426|nr:GntR family transcriptional regulator [Paracoccus sp. M683]TRW99493.1 GntR family transcriptional regulator [Paracoccus sp. M683]